MNDAILEALRSRRLHEDTSLDVGEIKNSVSQLVSEMNTELESVLGVKANFRVGKLVHETHGSSNPTYVFRLTDSTNYAPDDGLVSRTLKRLELFYDDGAIPVEVDKETGKILRAFGGIFWNFSFTEGKDQLCADLRCEYDARDGWKFPPYTINPNYKPYRGR